MKYLVQNITYIEAQQKYTYVSFSAQRIKHAVEVTHIAEDGR